ncbi:hypothetical protein [Mesorhizobium sp. B2-1-3A]|uniref:hypothetical protein n=1 Tax=Mesorhizobium sp. B2-1-3A TaxID=2589971 RepID=UPI00112ABF9E|nr:hypothetical protein [Mesorhizobium sp. B2-1-3A]TPM89827.1 hypothetical protein FJ977_35180 [Mesorhizobium sp. B2-1-3A]
MAKPTWRLGVWGDGSTPLGMANIFCDAYEVTIVSGIREEDAAAIVEAHNEALSALLGEMVLAAQDLLASLDPGTLNPEQFNAWHSLSTALTTEGCRS